MTQNTIITNNHELNGLSNMGEICILGNLILKCDIRTVSHLRVEGDIIGEGNPKIHSAGDIYAKSIQGVGDIYARNIKVVKKISVQEISATGIFGETISATENISARTIEGRMVTSQKRITVGIIRAITIKAAGGIYYNNLVAHKIEGELHKFR